MKKKVWDITVKDNPNRVVMGENDEFYTTDTEAYLVFKLDDENFNPATAVLTLENRNDGSLKNETVDVVDGLIEWEMPQRYIEHFGNWQGQLVYEDTKDGQPELYTSAPFTFVVNAHIGDKKKPSLVEIENWEKFIRDGTELIETWEDMEDLRQANEAQRQANYQELLDTGVLQTNINTKLEALEEEYAPKLTEVTAQLAQTVQEQSNKVDKAGSGQVKWANIAQDAREQISGDKVAVVDENSIITTNLTNNAVKTSKIGKGEVTPATTSFIKKSTNLLDREDVVADKVILNVGSIVDNPAFVYSHKIDVLPGQTLFTRYINYLAFYNQNDEFISRPDIIGADNAFSVVPENCYYVRASISKVYYGYQDLQISISDVEIPYEPFYEELDNISVHVNNIIGDEENPITPEKTSFLSIIDNLYEGTHLTGVTVTENIYIDYIYSEPSMADWQLAYIPIKNGETYTVRVSKNTDQPKLFVAFANGLSSGSPIERVYDLDSLRDEIVATVTNINDYKYMLIRADDQNKILQNIEIYESDSIPSEVPSIKINDVEIAKKSDIDNMRDNMRVKKHEGYLVTEHIDRYDGDIVTAEDVYALYDSLLADHEQYRTYRITKNLLGEDDFGNNIYEYVFSRDTLTNDYDIRRKRIGLTTTTHGIETNTTLGLFEFMKEIVINKDKNEVFNRIIGSVDIHIIPVLNPSGLALSTYHNGNDVDIFANFDVNWENQKHPNKGSSPASEPETQIAQNWMQQNMFDVYFDYHRADASITNNHFSWLSTDSEGALIEEYVKTIGLLSLIKSQQYEVIPPYETFGLVKDYPNSGKSYSYATSIGSEGALLEVSGTWRYFPNDEGKLSLLVDWSKELVGNMIMTVSRRWI